MTTKNLALGATYYNYVGMSKPAVDRQHQGQILLPKDKKYNYYKMYNFLYSVQLAIYATVN